MVRRWLLKAVPWVVILVVITGFGLYWFAPWKVFTSKRVDDAVPGVAAGTGSPSAVAPTNRPRVVAGATSRPADRLLARGTFVSHEHRTVGSVQLIALADGRRQLVLRDLSTSDGPDVWVWLSDQPVKSNRSSWSSFGTGHYVALARLKGNQGNQVYDIPADVDLSAVHSVSLWCRRFSVSFGAAALDPP